MTASKDKTGKEPRWRYRFTYRGRKYSGSAPRADNTKRAAELAELEHVRRLQAGLLPSRDIPIVRAFAVRFLQHQRANVEALTYELQAGFTEAHIVPALGHLRLDEVTLEQADAFTSRLRQTMSQRTANNRMQILKRLLSLAVEWKLLPSYPTFRSVPTGKRHPRFLDDAEIRRLFAAAAARDDHAKRGPDMLAMMTVAVRTGLRGGEIRGLEWADIMDLDTPLARLVVRRTDPGRPGFEPTAPKSGHERAIPLSPDAAAALAAWRDHPRRRRHRRVWTSRTGRRHTQGGLQQRMERLLVLAGIEGATMHVTRHTFASHLVMRGVPLRRVQELMGHASIQQTEVYAHLVPDLGQATVALLDLPLLRPGAPGQDADKRQLPPPTEPSDQP